MQKPPVCLVLFSDDLENSDDPEFHEKSCKLLGIKYFHMFCLCIFLEKCFKFQFDDKLM